MDSAYCETCNNGPKLLKMNRITNPIAKFARRIAPRGRPSPLDLSRPCSVVPFNNHRPPRLAVVPLCSGPSSLVLVQGTEVRILPGLPIINSLLEFREIKILAFVNLCLQCHVQFVEISNKSGFCRFLSLVFSEGVCRLDTHLLNRF